MIIIGADYHPGFQQIAFVDTDTGELQERRLEQREEAEKFYRDLAAQGMMVRVGMEPGGCGRLPDRDLRRPGSARPDRVVRSAVEVRGHEQPVPMQGRVLVQLVLHAERDRVAAAHAHHRPEVAR